MKKVVGLIVMLVMAIMMMTTVMADEIVHGDYCGSDIFSWVEEWAKCQGYEEYLDCDVDDLNRYYGYGVVDVDSFERIYEIECNKDNMIKVILDEYEGVNVQIKTVGFYDGYEVNLMIAESDGRMAIGYTYYEGNEIPYYYGELLFMAYSNEY